MRALAVPSPRGARCLGSDKASRRVQSPRLHCRHLSRAERDLWVVWYVRSGRSLLITNADLPVARLSPVPEESERCAVLAAEGLMEWSPGNPAGLTHPSMSSTEPSPTW